MSLYQKTGPGKKVKRIKKDPSVIARYAPNNPVNAIRGLSFFTVISEVNKNRLHKKAKSGTIKKIRWFVDNMLFPPIPEPKIAARCRPVAQYDPYVQEKRPSPV
jgi:hypothetical protein